MPLSFSHKYHLEKDFIPYKWRFLGFDTVFRSNKFPEMLFFAINYHRIIFFRIFAGDMMNALYKNYRLHYCFLMHGKEAVKRCSLVFGIYF